METVADKADLREVNGIRVQVNLAVLGTLTAAGGKTSAAFFSEMRCPGQGRRIGRIRRVQTAARRFGVLGIHAALVGPIAQKHYEVPEGCPWVELSASTTGTKAFNDPCHPLR